MTMHNAKGLEFDAVAVAGLEEGLLPHGSALESTEELEEERRLFYVAITRARDEVLLTAAAYRRRFDGARGSSPSRFVAEIPRALLQREATSGSWGDRRERPVSAVRWGRATDDAGFDSGDDAGEANAIPLAPGGGRTAQARRAVGRHVVHETFGPGKVLAAEGEGPNMKLTVQFMGVVKKVFARFVTAARDGD